MNRPLDAIATWLYPPEHDDITLAGAVIYTESKTRCRECTEGARREYKKRRRAQAD